VERSRTVVLLSEHELFRNGLAHVVRHAGYQVHVAATPTALRRTPPEADSVIVDLDHATGDAATLLLQTGAIIDDDAYVIAYGSALRLGASVDGAPAAAQIETKGGERALLAAIAKKPPAMSFELKRLHAQWAQVTPRQRDVLRWLAIGLDNLSIGRKLRVGERAVKAHVTSLLTLFGLSNRTELALLAEQAGLRPRSG